MSEVLRHIGWEATAGTTWAYIARCVLPISGAGEDPHGSVRLIAAAVQACEMKPCKESDEYFAQHLRPSAGKPSDLKSSISQRSHATKATAAEAFGAQLMPAYQQYTWAIELRGGTATIGMVDRTARSGVLRDAVEGADELEPEKRKINGCPT